jgi:hypothetical protein
MPFPYSSDVVAGTNATAVANNNQRKDALTRWFKFEVKGTLTVANGQGGAFVLPYAGNVVKIITSTTSGSATVRIKKDSSNVDTGVAASSTPAEDTTISSAAVAALQKLTMDITAVASGVDLIVLVEILCTP